MMCENYSLTHICPRCQTNFLSPSLSKRHLSNGIEVYSFYKYSEIKELLFTKHTDLGFYIYTLLAKNAFSPFAEAFSWEKELVSLAIDDNIKSGYSHTAILNKALKSKYIKPLYTKLRAKNSVNYSGKSKAFRIAHPRDFIMKDFSESDVILVDDIITTGTTLTQACQTVQNKGKEVIFCLTLVDVEKK
jgi:competence protein ComFC